MAVTRRKFLTRATLAASSLAMTQLGSFAEPVGSKIKQEGWSLKIMATNWGFGGSASEFCAKAKKEGYDGIEVWVPGNEQGRTEIIKTVQDYGLLVGFLCGGGDKEFVKHAEQFKSAVTAAAALKPVYINCHSGKDYFNFEQNRELMDFTAEVAAKTGVPVYHETHRGRSLFAAHITRAFIEKIPSLKLTFDVSHWCNVHESLLADQAETLELAISRTEHIHARIGHAEGPQVNDPRAPEWGDALKAHFAWWDKVVERKKREGKMMTILTEFGPPDYMPTLPYTRQPISGQWEINAFMMHTLRKRYSSML